MTHWFKACAGRQAGCLPWLVHDLAGRCGDDPAYVQSLRLLIREQRYHAQLITGLLEQCGGNEGQPAALPRDLFLEMGRFLGPRYTLASMLLADVIDVTLLRLIADRTANPLMAQICLAIITEKLAHIAFHRERLTMEFTEFNFVRRNMRRYRLRAILGIKFARMAVQHRSAIRETGLGYAAFAQQCWSRFEQILEQMVPYRRETLMNALVAQREKPYDKPVPTDL